MLPNGELIVYDSARHSVLRGTGDGYRCEQIPEYLDSGRIALREFELRECKHVGSVEGAFDGLAKLCRPPAMRLDVYRYLVMNGDKIKHATPFETYSDAKDWIDADWGGACNPRYSVVSVRVNSVPDPRPWAFPESR
jgi:hypothetical protein